MNYKLGSLFDGSGGFPLAGSLCGIEPVWASEVEPYPIAVTKSRFPNMKHLGNICNINGAEIEPVDIITFGSPCQDLSVAGKRAGLKHEANGDEETTRSGLFMEAVRIIKEMRSATNGRYPTFALWENVPGGFSSNQGEDFRIVLEELVKIAEPTAVMPGVPKNGWSYADCYRGDGWSLAYRVFDAQYWGVPQRRRRIHLVVDFRGERAEEVLFEREGLRGYFAESGEERQGAAGDAQNCSGTDDRKGKCYGVVSKGNGEAWCIDERHTALACGGGQAGQGFPCAMQPIVVATQQGGAEISENGICPTITAAAGMSGNNQPWICSLEPGIAAREGENGCLTPWDNQSKRVYSADGAFGSLYAGENSGQCQQAVAYGISSFESNAMKSANPHSGIYEADTARTLDLNGGNPACNQGGIAIIEKIVLDDQGGSQINVRTDGKAPTIRAEMHGNVPFVMEASGFKDPDIVAYCVGNGQLNQISMAEQANTLDCMHDQQAVAYVEPISIDRAFYNQGVRYIVRRLTPTECARLQGFPDKWGHPNPKTELTDEEYAFWCKVNLDLAIIGGTARPNDNGWYNIWREVKPDKNKGEDFEPYDEDTGKPYAHKKQNQMLKWYNKLHTDSAEYKMWGNGIALPPALYCMQGIVEAMEKETEDDAWML